MDEYLSYHSFKSFCGVTKLGKLYVTGFGKIRHVARMRKQRNVHF